MHVVPNRLDFLSLFLIGWLGFCAGVMAADEVGPNLVLNPSFESADGNQSLPADWIAAPSVYSRDPGGGRDDSVALKYVNQNPDRYCLAGQVVDLRPSRKYRFGGWVKTRDLQGDDSGATFCVEWTDKNGKWLGGSYPHGVKGTTNWTAIQGTAQVPRQAGSCRLHCYVRHGMTGTAWFDDVRLELVKEPPLTSTLTSPLYRGRITRAGPRTIRATVRVDLRDVPLQPAEVSVRGTLVSGEGVVCGRMEHPYSSSPIPLEFPVEDWKPGRYELRISLVASNGETIDSVEHALVRIPDTVTFHSAIDEHRRLLVEGKPFFPLGMYFSNVKEEDLRVYANSKFNCLMPYGSPSRKQMDLAERHGVKIIYSIKDWYSGSRWCPASIQTSADEERMVRDRVREFRDHPSLLAWYLNDELSQSFLPQLEAHRRWVSEEDPHHPTWSVLYQVNEVATYRETFDVIGTDPYPIGRKPASLAADWTAETFRQVDRSRPMWQVPQLHNWANYAKSEAERQKGRTPTAAEVRSMAWQCICEGATGLVFYSWYDIHRNPDVTFDQFWPELKQIAAEIDGLVPAVLSVESVPEIAFVGEQPDWLHWIARRHGDPLTLIAVNDGDGEGSIEFQLPSTAREIRVLHEPTVLSTNSARLRDHLSRLAVRVYVVTP